jgi:hypothetical protein
MFHSDARHTNGRGSTSRATPVWRLRADGALFQASVFGRDILARFSVAFRQGEHIWSGSVASFWHFPGLCPSFRLNTDIFELAAPSYHLVNLGLLPGDLKGLLPAAAEESKKKAEPEACEYCAKGVAPNDVL